MNRRKKFPFEENRTRRNKSTFPSNDRKFKENSMKRKNPKKKMERKIVKEILNFFLIPLRDFPLFLFAKSHRRIFFSSNPQLTAVTENKIQKKFQEIQKNYKKFH